jgi:hypothetical protein
MIPSHGRDDSLRCSANGVLLGHIKMKNATGLAAVLLNCGGSL